jgi:hypothetical protein
MMIIKKQFQFSIIMLLLLMLFSFKSNGQELWKKLDIEKDAFQKKEIRDFKNFPIKYSLYQLDIDQVRNRVFKNSKSSSKTILLPNATGVLEAFEIRESSNFEKGLAAKFPTIKSYSASGIENPTSFAKISLGSDGFHAVIFAANGKTVYIDPYSKDNQQYIVYKTSDLKEEDALFKCNVEEIAKKSMFTDAKSSVVNDGNLKIFRLALVCSGEYAQFHLENQNVSETASEAEKKTAVLSAMNTSMTRVNGVFEKDLAVKMVIVADNDKVIFLNAETDNITDGDPDKMIDEVQTIADSEIGNANYDIGHIFSTGGSGLAGLGVVCITGQKARGVTGRGSPIGDPYDIDYVAHEMGHQFGAGHTQNNSCNRSNSTAVEPGSASTIMGYAGICAPNVQSISDAYFHAVSITQMQAVIASSGSCANLEANGNNAPVANAGLNYNIPKSTPFILKGTATDQDGMASLTYNWEQIDNEIGVTMPPAATNTVGPMFRSLPSNTSPNRYMPALATVISGSISSTWEVVPNVARDMTFSLLVRDNNTTGGATSRSNMLVTVEDAIAFTVTSQDAAVTWDAGNTQTINWNKGTTDEAPIDCQNVTIKLSEDGGLTFPIILAENTPNDGSENIIVPNNVTTQARIMVAATDNIFYNVNAVNFEIQSTIPSFVLKNTSGDLFACNSGDQTVDYTLNLDFINGFSETVSFATTGQPAGSVVSFSPSTVNEDGDVVMSISNLDGITAQDYTVNIEGNSTSVNQNIAIKLSITASDLETVTLVSPANGATGISLADSLTWQEDTNASFYVVEVATDATFSDVIATGEPTTNAFNLMNLEGDTEYYWRVKAKNSCNEGSFSSAFSFTTEIPSYCTSTFTDEAGGGEHIINVTFGGINNTSDNNITDGYSDFTSINTNILRGQTKEISVTLDTDGFQDHCFVFIDWNQDFVFDKTTERYDLGSKTEDIGTATFSIKVPLDARFGKTRMRVLIEYDDPSEGFGDGACDADHLTEYGETEDYSLTVVEPVLNDNNYTIEAIAETFYNKKDGIINVSMIQSEFNYLITVVGDVLNNSETISNTSYSIEDLSPGDYEVCITAIEADVTECFAIVINKAEAIISFDNYTIQTTSESCVDENDGIITVDINQSEFDYQVSVSGPSTNINELLTGTTYTLSGLAPGDYEVCFLIEELNYTQCFELNIVASEQIALKVASKQSNIYSFNIESGTAPFKVYLNEELLSVSDTKEFELEIFGNGKLEVKTAKDCEGVYKTGIGEVTLKQNPVSDSIDLLLPMGISEPNVNAIIFDLNGKIIFSQRIKREENTLSIPFKDYALGVYILKLSIENSKPIKIIK